MAARPYSLSASGPVRSLYAPKRSKPVWRVSVPASPKTPRPVCLRTCVGSFSPASRDRMFKPLLPILLTRRSAPNAVSRTAAAAPVPSARVLSSMPFSRCSERMPPYSWTKLPRYAPAPAPRFWPMATPAGPKGRPKAPPTMRPPTPVATDAPSWGASSPTASLAVNQGLLMASPTVLMPDGLRNATSSP